jgi:hypothetical protein
MNLVIFNKESWYRLLEGTCQFVAVAMLVHGAWVTGLSKSVDTAAFLKVLPIPALFLLTSMFFRFLSSTGNQMGTSPFIASILTMFQILDITGVHLLVLGVLAVLSILAALTDGQQLKELCKYLIGFFAGMQLEKKREKAAAKG